MVKATSKGDVSNQKECFLVIFLLINSLTWLFIMRRNIYMVLEMLEMGSQQSLLLWGIFDSAIIGSAVVGAVLSDRLKRIPILYSWLCLGVVSSAMFHFVQHLPLWYSFLCFLFWGISFGLGMPSCLAHFADQSVFEDRGYKSGIVVFATNALAALIVLLTMNFALNIELAVGWRMLGLVVLVLIRPKGENIPSKRRSSFKHVVGDRQFLLYLIPWLMFSLIYGFQKVMFEQFLPVDQYETIRVIGAVFGTISAIVTGVLCDWIGRKRLVIFGFVSLGVAYAVVGFASWSPISWYLYGVIDGVAWGIFLLMFVLVLWGDISSSSLSFGEKHYAIGSIPFFFADFVGFLFVPIVGIPIELSSSIAGFFLFLAVMPLMYALETLPEKNIRKRQLEKYVEQAKRMADKSPSSKTVKP